MGDIVGERNVDFDDDEHEPPASKADEKPEEKGGILGDLIRKTVLTGVGALFMTEEGIRNAAGQLKLPKDALAYVVGQADKTRSEVVRVVTQELRRFLESETLRREAWKLLTGVTLEINATVQLKPSGEPGMKVSLKKKKPDDGKPEAPRDGGPGSEEGPTK